MTTTSASRTVPPRTRARGMRPSGAVPVGRRLLFADRRRSLPWASLAIIVSYPLVWTTYTMVRGERVANPDGSTPWWYPYGFLDPHTAGYGSAFSYIGGILVAFVLLGVAIIGIGRVRARHSSRGGASKPPRFGRLAV